MKGVQAARYFTGILILSILMLSACGKGKSEPASGSFQDPKFPIASAEEAARMLKAGSVTCQDPRNCSPSIAFILIADLEGSSINMCSSFLVDDRHLITNSHCIPQALKSPGSDCKNAIRAYFPNTIGSSALNAFSAFNLACSRVLSASNISSTRAKEFARADYAVLELEHPVARPSLRLSEQGFQDQEKVISMRINPVPGKLAGLLVHETCAAIMNSASNPFYSSASSPIQSVDCKIIPGNSGSPLLGTDGTVRAITQAHISDEFKSELQKTALEPLDTLGLATNFGCLSLPELQFRPVIQTACLKSQSMELYELTLEEAQKNTSDLITQSIQKELNAFLVPSAWALADIVPDTDPMKPNEYLSIPKCFLPVQGKINPNWVLQRFLIQVGLNRKGLLTHRLKKLNDSMTVAKLNRSAVSLNDRGFQWYGEIPKCKQGEQ